MKSDAGFTLLELIVGVFIFGLVTGTALPSLSRIQDQMMMAQDARLIALTLAEVRAEAIRMRTTVTIEFDSSGFTWDYASIAGDVDGTCEFSTKTSWAGSVPTDFEFNGFGLAPALTSLKTLTIENGSNTTSIVINQNGAIST